MKEELESFFLFIHSFICSVPVFFYIFCLFLLLSFFPAQWRRGGPLRDRSRRRQTATRRQNREEERKRNQWITISEKTGSHSLLPPIPPSLPHPPTNATNTLSDSQRLGRCPRAQTDWSMLLVPGFTWDPRAPVASLNLKPGGHYLPDYRSTAATTAGSQTLSFTRILTLKMLLPAKKKKRGKNPGYRMC